MFTSLKKCKVSHWKKSHILQFKVEQNQEKNDMKKLKRARVK